MAALLFAGTMFLASCSSSKDAVDILDAEDRFARGKQKFDGGDYLDAIDEFQIVTIQFRGSAVADDAQYYLGECYFERHEYIIAASEYETLIRRMRASDLIPLAQYKRAMCYHKLSPRADLDQQHTKKAIDTFQEFIEYNPTHELVPDAETRIVELNNKLAEKMYKNGNLYVSLHYYRSARIEFERVLEVYHDSEWADDANIGLAKLHLNRKRYRDAKDAIERFFIRFPDSPLRTAAESLQKEIDSKLNREPKLNQKPKTASPGAPYRDGKRTPDVNSYSPHHVRD